MELDNSQQAEHIIRSIHHAFPRRRVSQLGLYCEGGAGEKWPAQDVGMV